MNRFVLAGSLSLVFLTQSMATLTTRNEDLSGSQMNRHLADRRLPALSADGAYRITENSEVLLDGRRCSYEKVPNSARIILMEIDSEDSRVILRIHFRSRN